MVSTKKNLRDEMLDDISAKFARAMDWEIIADVLVDSGWISIRLNRFITSEQAVDIKIWMEENCTGKWDSMSTRFLFEKKQDAEWFVLKWV